VDARDVVDGQWPQRRGIAADEPLEAVANADDLESLVDRLDGCGRDDGVDPWGRPTTDEDGEPFRSAHD